MVSGAIALAGLGYSIYSAEKKHEAEQKAANNKQPDYKIPEEEQANLKLAESYANQGMSAGARNAYQNSADRGLTSTTNAILRGGGDANAIGGAYDRYNEGISNMSLYDDKVRTQHLQDLMGQNSRMAAYRDKSYQVNEYGPWANKAQALAQQMAAAQQGQTSGMNTAISGFAGMAQGLGGNGDKVKSPGWNNPHTASPGQMNYETSQPGTAWQPSTMNNPYSGYIDSGNGSPYAPTNMGMDSGAGPQPNYGGYKPFYEIDSSPGTGGWNGGMF